MKRSIATLACPILAAVAIQAQGTTILRCEDAQGRISYSQHGCPPGHAQQTRNISNPSPGDSEPMARTARNPNPNTLPDAFHTRGIGAPDDGCGNKLDSRARREAIIRGQIRAGMNQSNVKSALGKPQRIVRQNGTTRFLYQTKNGRSQQVSFDENGCVKGNR